MINHCAISVVLKYWKYLFPSNTNSTQTYSEMLPLWGCTSELKTVFEYSAFATQTFHTMQEI